MAAARLFFECWAMAFVTLCLALTLMSLYYRIINFDLEFHGPGKEALIALVAAAVQGAGFWFSASLFNGDPFRRLVIPGAIVALIYWIAHLDVWSGYEVGGIAYFQSWILTTALGLYSGELKLAIIFFGLFLLGLVFIATIAKSL